jgi:hypothetical protein
MFDDHNNLIGLLLLGLCAAAGGVLVWAIVTDSTLEYHGPAWLTWLLGIVFVGALLYGVTRGGLGRGQWPHPMSGQRRWWRFWRKE